MQQNSAKAATLVTMSQNVQKVTYKLCPLHLDGLLRFTRAADVGPSVFWGVFSRQIPFFKMAISGVFFSVFQKIPIFHNFSSHFRFFSIFNSPFSVLNKVCYCIFQKIPPFSNIRIKNRMFSSVVGSGKTNMAATCRPGEALGRSAVILRRL